MAAAPFDVFLSYNRTDAPSVERLARWLREEGLTPWLDRWSLFPGHSWQPAIAAGQRPGVRGRRTSHRERERR